MEVVVAHKGSTEPLLSLFPIQYLQGISPFCPIKQTKRVQLSLCSSFCCDLKVVVPGEHEGAGAHL